MKSFHPLIEEAVATLEKVNSVLIVAHQKPDGDALGACLAMKSALELLGKKVVVANSSPAPFELMFLPGSQNLSPSVHGQQELVLQLPITKERTQARVRYEVEEGMLKIYAHSGGIPFREEELTFGVGAVSDADMIISLDTPELSMLGEVYEKEKKLFSQLPIINIDHHISNTEYGSVNVINSRASATCEIIYELLLCLEEKKGCTLITEDVATFLLTGIITDTGSFQHSNTTPHSFDVAATLIEKGARQQEIIHNMYKTKRLSTLKSWGRVLENLVYDEENAFLYSFITESDLKECSATDEEIGSVIDELLVAAPNAECVVLLKHSPHGTRASVRTKNANISAQDIAALFGGGGHGMAAGFCIKNKKVEDCTKKVIDEITAFLQKKR